MAEDPFQLKQLPTQPPPAALWDAIDRELARPEHATAVQRRPGLWLPGAAVAATLLLAAVLYWQPTELVVPTVPVADSGTDNNNAVSLAVLQQNSVLLQNRLRQLRNGVIRSQDLAGMTLLQSELRLTDELLSEQPDNRRLWQQRNAVLATMAQQYQSGDWQTQIQLASY